MTRNKNRVQWGLHGPLTLLKEFNVRVKINVRLERPSTGSKLETGIDFRVKPEESRIDHVHAAETLVSQNFPGWQISAIQFTGGPQ